MSSTIVCQRMSQTMSSFASFLPQIIIQPFNLAKLMSNSLNHENYKTIFCPYIFRKTKLFVFDFHYQIFRQNLFEENAEFCLHLIYSKFICLIFFEFRLQSTLLISFFERKIVLYLNCQQIFQQKKVAFFYLQLLMSKICSQNHSTITLFEILVTLLVLLQNANSQQQSSLLINGNFSLTNLSGQMVVNFPSSIPGWNCTTTCQVVDCIPRNQYYSQYGLYNANCTGFAVDLISNDVQNLTQNVILGPYDYLLSLNYYYPRVNANLKTLSIYFNEVKIFNFTPNVSFLYLPQYVEKQVQGIVGVNTLRLTTKRNSGFDGNGFFVNNIKLIKTSNSLKQLINSTILSDLTVIMTKIPGSRVIFADFMSFFVNFDRLQFYYFHDRNYSQYSTVLLTDINILNNLKGLFFQSILQLANPNISNYIDSFFSSIDYKYRYSQSIILQRNGSNGRGFVNNCYSFFVYTIPGTIITYLVFLALFKFVRKRPASRLIRQFSFFGMLIVMVFQGNIESLTYYSIGEISLLFSSNLQHKCINVFIIFFQLIVTLVSVGSILYFKHHYKRLIFYFIENKRNNEFGILCQTVDNGIICLIFGFIHQILFSKPQLQLFVLLFLECVWMIFKIYFLFKNAYQKKCSEFIMFNTGIVRICFIITFYFYQDAVQIRILINDAIHSGLVAITLFLWLQELIVSLFQLIIFFPKFFARLKLFQQKVKLAKQKKQQIAPFDEALNMIQRKINERIIKAKNGSTNSSLFKAPLRNSIIRPTNKGRSFKSQKVRIARLRIQRLMSGNQDSEKIK